MDKDIGTCAGYNYIIALLMRFIDDEEAVFWCLLQIMTSLNWRRFFICEDKSMKIMQERVPDFLKSVTPRLYQYMNELCETQTMSLTMTLP